MIEHLPVPTTGEELLRLAASVTPAQLPPHIREDVQQAICLDLLTERVEAGTLRDARFVRRRYVNDAYGLSDRFRFISTDAPIYADGMTTVGERLRA
jgi:hypothetical protein